MNSATAFIDTLQMNGQLVFTTGEAVDALDRSVPAVRAQLRRLKAAGKIVSPYRGFFVIVPPAYRRLGCLPPEQFVPQLMAHLGEPYYVGLLTAAAYYGAAHQAPMSFQVMLRTPRRGLRCGAGHVEFIGRKDMESTPVLQRNTPTGYLRVSSPAATAIEIVAYPERCGFLDNVATVLGELAESIAADALKDAVLHAPSAWLQRLGFLLTLVDQGALAAPIEEILSTRETFTVALAPWERMDGAPRDARWKLALNVEVEPDL